MKKNQENQTVKSYRQVFKSFGKEKDINDLDYQDSVQDAILDNLLKSNENLTVSNLRHAAKQNWIDAKRKLARFDLTSDNLDSEIYARNLGEVMEAKQAIDKALEPLQAEIVSLYGQGYTLKEIASLKGFKHDMEVKRILDKAEKKIDSLCVSYLYDERYATYQHKGKRDKPKFSAKPEANGIAINRRFLCLDQTRNYMPKTKPNYSANVCPVKPKGFEIIEYIAAYNSHKVYEYKHTISDNIYSNQTYNGVIQNKEYIQIKANEAKYNKMICASYKKPEKTYRFGNGKFVSFDGNYLNI
jgi:DNA-directed RNA polymerase specialized sigma24 family protein